MQSLLILFLAYGLWHLAKDLYSSYGNKLFRLLRRLASFFRCQPLSDTFLLADAKATLVKAAGQLNAKADLAVEDKKVQGTLKYQGGIFGLSYSDNGLKQIEVVFPGVFSARLDNIDAVRSLCNYINQMESPSYAYYTMNDNDNEVVVHLKAYVRYQGNVKALQDSLETAFDLCFSLRQHYHALFDEHIGEMEKNQDSDLEYTVHRQSALNRVLELQVANTADSLADGGHVGFNHDTGITAGQWLDAMGFLRQNKLVRLECMTKENYEYADTEDDIRSYPLLNALHENEDGQPAQNASIRISYIPFDAPHETDCKPTHALSINITLERTNDSTAYYRLDYIMPQMDGGEHGYMAKADVASHPLSGSMLVAVDTTTEQKARAEFRYMWGDAHDKLKENKKSKLTPEQQQLLRFATADNGYYAYWGHRYLREKRYLEAYLMLQPVWLSVNAALAQEMNEQGEAYFCDICYWMATCLYRLGQPRRALYYLDFCRNKNQTNYTTLAVRCYMATHDYRALSFVQTMLATITSNINELTEAGQEVPEDFVKFRQFLRRSEVQVLIDCGKFSQARKKCSKMLDEKDYQTFAIEQLEIIESREHTDEPVSDDTTGKDIPSDASTSGTATTDDSAQQQ